MYRCGLPRGPAKKSRQPLGGVDLCRGAQIENISVELNYCRVISRRFLEKKTTGARKVDE